MAAESGSRPNWAQLWRSGALPRFCFISLGVSFHAGAETMISTITPAMVRDIGGIQLIGWSFAIYEIGSIVAGAAAGWLCRLWSIRSNMIVAALVFSMGEVATALSPTMYWALGGRLLSGFGGGALVLPQSHQNFTDTVTVPVHLIRMLLLMGRSAHRSSTIRNFGRTAELQAADNVHKMADRIMD